MSFRALKRAAERWTELAFASRIAMIDGARAKSRGQQQVPVAPVTCISLLAFRRSYTYKIAKPFANCFYALGLLEGCETLHRGPFSKVIAGFELKEK